MIKLVPYKKELLKDWEYTGLEKHLFSGPGEVRSVINDYCTRGRGVVGYNDKGQIIGAAGVIPWDMEGTGYSWSFINKEAVVLGIELLRTVKELQDEFAAEMGIHRMISDSEVTDREITKYMMLLGYEIEGVLEKHGPQGQDMYRFTKKVQG